MSNFDNKPVTSVFGRDGAIVAAGGDYSFNQLAGNISTSQMNTGTGATASTFWRGDGTWAAAGGGSDPWTYVKRTSDFTTTSATAVAVTGFAFTPAANTQYEVHGMFLLRTNTTTVGPRPGCAWPTGLTDGVVAFEMTSSATAQVLANGNFNAAVLCPVGGLPNTTQSYPCLMDATFTAGPTPSSTFQIQLASETAGTTVTMKTGSFIRYRVIP